MLLRQVKLMDERRYTENQCLNILDECILVLDQSGRITSANDFACSLFEAERSQIEGVIIKSLMNIDVTDPYINEWMQIRSGTVDYHTYEFVGLKGTRFLGNMKLLHTASEIESTFFCRISDAVLDTGNLCETFPKQKLINQIIKEKIGAVFIKNISGRYIFANEIFYNRCNNKIDSVVNLCDEDIFNVFDKTLFASTDIEVVESGFLKSYYHWNDEENSERIFYHTIKYPIFDLRGRTVGILGLSFDITNRRDVVEDLLRDSHKSVSINNSKRIGYVLHELICDTEGRPIDYIFLDMNRTYEELTGLKYQEVIGKRVLEIFPDTEKHWIEFFGNVAITGVGRSYENFSKELGKTYSVEAFQMDPGFFCVLVQDITIMKDTEQQLIALYEEANLVNRTKEQFLMNMSHEIRTPLNGINGVLELISNTRMDEDQKHYFSLLNSSFKSLSTILTEIIDYTHMTISMVQLVEESFNLKELMDEIANVFVTPAFQKGLDFQIKYKDCHAPLFLGDRIKLKQLLMNIIGNAIKFTMLGTVNIEISCNGNEHGLYSICIRVVDSGIGIDEKDKEMIFGLFNQKSEGIGKRFSGLGLGLAISNEICKSMGASITIESQLGKGTVVDLVIPLRKELTSDQSNRPVKESNLSEAPVLYRVLVVEDDQVSGMFLEMMLQNEGYHVMIAKDGREALEILGKEQVDIVLMDIDLPEIDGFEITRLFKNMKPEAIKIPVIAITGYVTDENRKRSYEVGMVDFVPKPIGKTDLVNLLTKWL